MDILAFPPIALLLDAAHSGMLWLIGVLDPVAGPLSAAVAVALLTVLVRTALIPVAVAQARAEQTRARLAPHVRELQRRHRGDPERMQRELLALYGREGASPTAGCLPLLIQAPVLGLVYSLFIAQMIARHPNALLTEHLFGVPLGSSLAGSVVHGTADLGTIVVFGAIALAIAAVGELTRRLFRPELPPADPEASGAASVLASPAFAQAMGVLQFVTAVVSLFVPLAAAVYLLVTVVWTLAQRLVLRRRYPVTRITGGPTP